MKYSLLFFYFFFKITIDKSLTLWYNVATIKKAEDKFIKLSGKTHGFNRGMRGHQLCLS